MRRALLLLALLLPAAPARAGWSAPAPVAPLGAGSADATVAPDGFTVATWSAGNELVARAGHGQPTVLRASGFGGAALAGTAVAWTDDRERVVVARARHDGFFAPPTVVGPGELGGLAVDAHGDTAALLGPTIGSDTYNVAFRPAGGAFGALAQIPETNTFSAPFGLTARGETFLATAPHGTITSVAASTRRRNGPVQTTDLGTAVDGNYQGFKSALAADDRGRLLAAWLSPYGDTLFTAVRSAGGTWSAPVPQTLLTRGTGLVAGTGAAGDAVIAWHDLSQTASALHIETGTLGSAAFGAPQTFAGDTIQTPVLRTERDGSTAIVYADGDAHTARLVRRHGLRAFHTPRTIACGVAYDNVGIAGVLRGGRLVVRVGNSLVRELPGSGQVGSCVRARAARAAP